MRKTPKRTRKRMRIDRKDREVGLERSRSSMTIFNQTVSTAMMTPAQTAVSPATIPPPRSDYLLASIRNTQPIN